MATVVSLLCDLDSSQSEDVQTVTWTGLDGVTRQADFSVYAREAFEKAMAPFVAVGVEKVIVTKSTASKADKEYNAALREWAKSKGLDIGERGRISEDVRSQYDAHLASEAAKPVKRTAKAADKATA